MEGIFGHTCSSGRGDFGNTRSRRLDHIYDRQLIEMLIILFGVIKVLWSELISSYLIDTDSTFPDLVPCVPTVQERKQYIVFINLMVLEAPVTGLTIWSAINHWRHTNSLLIKTLYKDGVLCFVCLLCKPPGQHSRVNSP